MPCNDGYMDPPPKKKFKINDEQPDENEEEEVDDEEEEDDDEYDDDGTPDALRSLETKEAQLQKTAKLYKFALETLNGEIPKGLNKAIKNPNCRDSYVVDLCKLIRSTPKRLRAKILLGDSFESKALSVWWEEHKEADAVRVKKEETIVNNKKIVDNALARLSKQEKDLLRAYFKKGH